MADDKSSLKSVMLVGHPLNFGIDIHSLEGRYEVLSADTTYHAKSMIKNGDGAPIDLLVVKGEGSIGLIDYANREKPDAKRVYALTGVVEQNDALVNRIIGKLKGKGKGFDNVVYFKQPANSDELAARIKELIHMKKILFVCGSESVKSDYVSWFRDSEDYIAIATTDPDKAIKTAKEGGIAVVIAHLSMQEMKVYIRKINDKSNGESLIGKIHEISPGTKFIITSEYQRDDLWKWKVFDKLKFNGITPKYMQEPCLPYEIKNSIKSLIGE